MLKFFYNLGVVILYCLLTYAALSAHVDFACGFSLVCDVGDMEQFFYQLTGSILVFLNLWFLFFYINVDFFRDDAVHGTYLIKPAVISTMLAALTFAGAIYIVSLIGFMGLIPM